jgi:hypothetical protein|tara:strand:+ start:741 stop:1325 length:585 start_codon:yes stop_codon:yes gene_type:complete
MGMIARAGDLLYTFRFLTLLVTPFERTNAYKFGIIDKSGKRIKEKEIKTSQEKGAYTHFHRMVFNIKKLLGKFPGGKTTIASYAAALYLIKEKLELSDKSIKQIVEKCGHTTDMFLAEENTWFMLENNILASGVYRIKYDKVVNSTIEEVVRAKDQIRVSHDCNPVGDIFGLHIYEATHLKTNQKIYVSAEELM